MKLTLSRPVILWSVSGAAIVLAVAAVVWFGVAKEEPTAPQLHIPENAAEFLSNDDWYASGGPYRPQGPSAPLTKAWTIGSDRNVVRVTATDDMVYVYAKPDRIEAIDPDTGRTLWTFQLSNKAVENLRPPEPELAQDWEVESLWPEIRAASETVYISSPDKFIYVLDAPTGTRRQKIAGDFSQFDGDKPKESAADWPIRTRAIFPPDAIATTRGATVFVTSPEQPAPRFSDDGAPETQPVEKYLFAFTPDGDAIWSLTALTRTLTVFDEQTGSLAWTHEFVPNTSGIWSPVVTAQDVYLWKYKDLVSIDGRTGRKNWTHAFKDGAPVMPTFTDNYAFIGSKDRLRVYDRQGKEVWSTGIRNSFPPVVRSDFLLVLTDGPTGNLVVNAFTARD